VRYEALQEMARTADASRIATAHQSNDQVESFLLARRRRGGVASLAGPRRLREDGVARPLLDVSRREIEAFLAARGLSWRRDASNGDLSLSRNRVRRELAALVADRGPRAFDELLALAVATAAERDRVEKEFDETLRARIDVAAGRATADAEALRAAARDVQRLAVERMALPFGRPGRAPLTGLERERLLDRLAAGGDFRFEAGRRIRFQRRGALVSAYLVRT
jgi:tRNA(Ile)-lysidine synthase